MRKVDSNALTVRQTLNVQGKNNNRCSRNECNYLKLLLTPTTGNAQGVRELYEVIGGSKILC
jgi:hypothetical protein